MHKISQTTPPSQTEGASSTLITEKQNLTQVCLQTHKHHKTSTSDIVIKEKKNF